MAQKITVTLTDDLDPNKTADETIEFSLDGHHYTIDLSAGNADKLRKTFAPWVDSASKVSGRNRGRKLNAPRNTSNKDELNRIREWAVASGLKVSNRGRIPAGVVDAYHNRNLKTAQENVTEVLASAAKRVSK